MGKCKEKGCDRQAVTMGLCGRCYQRDYRARKRQSSNPSQSQKPAPKAKPKPEPDDLSKPHPDSPNARMQRRMERDKRLMDELEERQRRAKERRG